MGAELFILVFLGASVAITLLLGRYMASVFDGRLSFLQPIETACLKLAGVSALSSQPWQKYAKDFLLFNLLCGVLAFVILLFQNTLPINPLGLSGMEPWQAFNTVCSFVTNTNWQSYSGEVTLSNLSQMMAITFLQVVGAVSGVAVCIAFLRGLTHRPLGHFYQDFTKALLYVFLPVMIIGSLLFIWQGVPQTLDQQVVAHTVENTTQKISLGPVASLLTIKQFGTNGGGFFNANSAHPLENPNAFTNFMEIMLELAIPMGLIYLFGLWLKDRKQGWMIWLAMMVMFLSFWSIAYHFETAGNPILSKLAGVPGGNLEGKELRFGLLSSTLFTTATTATSTGAVNNMHDSLTPLAGMGTVDGYDAQCHLWRRGCRTDGLFTLWHPGSFSYWFDGGKNARDFWQEN